MYETLLCLTPSHIQQVVETESPQAVVLGLSCTTRISVKDVEHSVSFVSTNVQHIKRVERMFKRNLFRWMRIEGPLDHQTFEALNVNEKVRAMMANPGYRARSFLKYVTGSPFLPPPSSRIHVSIRFCNGCLILTPGSSIIYRRVRSRYSQASMGRTYVSHCAPWCISDTGTVADTTPYRGAHMPSFSRYTAVTRPLRDARSGQ